MYDCIIFEITEKFMKMHETTLLYYDDLFFYFLIKRFK